jgi:hypothetical protein
MNTDQLAGQRPHACLGLCSYGGADFRAELAKRERFLDEAGDSVAKTCLDFALIKAAGSG